MAKAVKRTADPAELEAQADALLQRDAELIAKLGAHADAMRDCYQELLKPRNDPEYLKRLEQSDADRSAIANEIDKVHIVPDKGRTWLALSLTSRSHAKALETARRLGDHFEAQIHSHEDPADETRLADRTQAQPAKHSFGREKRSLS